MLHADSAPASAQVNHVFRLRPEPSWAHGAAYRGSWSWTLTAAGWYPLRVMRFLTITLVLFSVAVHAAERATVEHYATNLASLINPAKLTTLGTRGANPRIQKAFAILAAAESEKSVGRAFTETAWIL